MRKALYIVGGYLAAGVTVALIQTGRGKVIEPSAASGVPWPGTFVAVTALWSVTAVRILTGKA